MQNYSIGLSGLSAAQKALVIIGNNIANAATEGYHRQRIELTPSYMSEVGSVLVGGGVDVSGITRMIDSLLEREILRQQSALAQVSRELTTLRTVENAFGEISTGGLSTAIDEFFNALRDLSAHPTEIIWQSQAVTAAETMAGQFRTLAEFLTTLETQIRLEAENVIESVNTLTSQIAELNNDIQRMQISGGNANNLRDQRDRCITELSELIGVETQARDYGVVDVTAGGISVVTAYNYKTDVSGGKIGGLLSLKNDTLADIRSDLDDLAGAIIQQINQYHVQGVGSEGSFTELTGWTNTSGDLSDFSTVSAGYVYIRVTNTSSQAVARTAIPVLQGASSDTLTEIASYITSNVANVTASVNSSNQLTITPDTGYKFDFLPAVLPEPEAADIDFNGSSDPTVSVSGIYTGSSNDTFTFTVSGTGNVGNGTLSLTVTNGASETVATLNIGSGYAAGDKLDVGNGIKVSLGTGDLVDGDSFSIDAFSDTDTSGVLAAVGINTFFSGSDASDIAVCSDIDATPGRVATALDADMTDNTNALRLAGLKDETLSSLSSMTLGEFYQRLVTDVGQKISVKQMREDNIEVIVQNLANQQSDISGVNINDEAAQILVFEQMFQAMAKYLGTVQSTISSLMEIV
jgi:flagellar hook-associated protein 1 FlgK